MTLLHVHVHVYTHPHYEDKHEEYMYIIQGSAQNCLSGGFPNTKLLTRMQ